jgi:transposase-like protein
MGGVMLGRTTEEQRRILAEYRASGGSVKAFCQRHKIGVATFYYWRKRENKIDKVDNHTPRLLPVIACEQLSLDSVEISLPKGMIMRFSPGASASYITTIIKRLT